MSPRRTAAHKDWGRCRTARQINSTNALTLRPQEHEKEIAQRNGGESLQKFHSIFGGHFRTYMDTLHNRSFRKVYGLDQELANQDNG